MEYLILYIVDGILLLLLLCTILRCAHLGLVRSLAGIAAWIAAAAIALHFCAPLSQTLYDRVLHERVLQLAQENVRNTFDADQTVDITTSVLDELPEMVVQAAAGMGIDVSALRARAVRLPHAADDAAAAVERNVLAPVITAALRAVLFILMVLLIAGAVQALLTPIGKALHKTPVIGSTDRALGAVLGLLKGAVLVSVLAILLRVLAEIVQGTFETAVQHSKIVSFVSESPFSNGVFR